MFDETKARLNFCSEMDCDPAEADQVEGDNNILFEGVAPVEGLYDEIMFIPGNFLTQAMVTPAYPMCLILNLPAILPKKKYRKKDRRGRR